MGYIKYINYLSVLLPLLTNRTPFLDIGWISINNSAKMKGVKGEIAGIAL
jgi:hypothetical protein